MLSFDGIPSTLRVPLAYVEFNNSAAVSGTPGQTHRILVFGQMLATGTATAGELVPVLGADQAEELFGRGSMLAGMFSVLKANNRMIETLALPMTDDGAAVAATGTVTLGGAPTAAGTLTLYIAGQRLRVAVASGAALADIASAVAAAVTADTSLPVTASAAAEVVTLTARNKCECGNDIDLRTNYYLGEKLPAGLSVTFAAMSGGSGNPDIATAIAALGDEWFTQLVMPWTDAANLTALETELLDRWGPLRQIDGLAFTAYRGSHAATVTFGDGRNSHLVSCIDTDLSPSPPCQWAAAYAAQAAGSLAIDPARPLQTLPLVGILPAAEGSRRTLSERNLLLHDGISTHTVDAGGRVLIERAVTMYQENAYGVSDPSYLDLNTPATLSYLRYATRARITQKYPRHKLASDGTAFGAGQAIVTPGVIRAELIALFVEWETAGLVEGRAQFKAELLVEIDASDPTRINVLSPPNLVNQFRIFANQIQFRL